MFYRERFYDLGSTYVIADAGEFRRGQGPANSSLDRVSGHEARRVLGRIARQDPQLLARLYEASIGVRPSAGGRFSPSAVPNPGALIAFLFEAFGADRATDSHRTPPRFCLLRAHRDSNLPVAPTDSPESRRMDAALAKLGRGPLTYRGTTYHLQRSGGQDKSRSNRDAYEAMSEALLFEVLRELGDDPATDPSTKSAAQELLSAAQDQRAKKGSTELLLLRRQRLHVRPADEAAPITPSQLRRTVHFVAVEVVDEDEKPVAGVSVEVQLSDGDVKQGISGDDGMVRIEPAPPGNAIIRLRAIDGKDWRPASGGARSAGQGATRYYTVKQGDTLARVARRFGQRSWKSVWEAAENEELRKKRKSPHVLHPGDVVCIPGIALNECEKPVDQVHRLIMKPDAKVTLRLNLLGKKLAPLDGATCKIFAGDELLFEGPVSSGKIECEIPLSVTEARLLVSSDGFEFERPLHIGGLDPNDEVSGVQARLSNLGWFSGQPDGTSSEALMLAQNTFRDEHELEPADALNDELFSELHKAHLV